VLLITAGFLLAAGGLSLAELGTDAPFSNQKSAAQPKYSSAATCTPPPSTAAPSATSTAGPRAPRSRTRYASSARTPRQPPAQQANWKRHSRPTPNAGTSPRS
jgi:hypothetical protein